MSTGHKIIVLGAGIAGLAAASRLRKNGWVIEQKATFGGLCTTTELKGFRFDQTGHLLHLRDPQTKRAILSALSKDPIRIKRRARVFSNGVYTPYPFQAHTQGLPKKIALECLVGFIQAAANNKKGAIKQTFEDFIYNHFGDGIAKHFMIPYNTKLWGTHPRNISAAWCKRFVPVPTAEEVVRGAIGMAGREMGYNAAFWYPKTGIGELPRAFLKRAHHIEYGKSPQRIDVSKNRVLIDSTWHPYQALVSTIPLAQLIKLITASPKWARDAASLLRCASLRYLDIALNRRARNDYHWIYVPQRKFPFYRVGCYSNFSEKMAPRGKSNLYVELSSRRPINIERDLPRVTAGLMEMAIVDSPTDIEFAVARHLRHAYVIYDDHREKAVPKLLNWLASHRIFCAGRYGVWEYGSMEDSIRQGFESAARAKECL